MAINLAQLKSIPSVRFYPWVGEHFGSTSRFGLPLLILGESHYGSEDEYCPELTQKLTRKYMERQFSHRFWTNIGQVLMARPYREFERKDVWGHIAFYNYVQEFAADSSRVAPSSAMWQEAERPFLEILHVLKPKLVLVMGARLWSNLSNEGTWGPKVRIGSTERDTFVYSTVGKGRSLAASIRHPSTSFNWRDWSPWVSAYLKAAQDESES